MPVQQYNQIQLNSNDAVHNLSDLSNERGVCKIKKQEQSSHFISGAYKINASDRKHRRANFALMLAVNMRLLNLREHLYNVSPEIRYKWKETRMKLVSIFAYETEQSNNFGLLRNNPKRLIISDSALVRNNQILKEIDIYLHNRNSFVKMSALQNDNEFKKILNHIERLIEDEI